MISKGIREYGKRRVLTPERQKRRGVQGPKTTVNLMVREMGPSKSFRQEY
jgi:hypothetical protein